MLVMTSPHLGCPPHTPYQATYTRPIRAHSPPPPPHTRTITHTHSPAHPRSPFQATYTYKHARTRALIQATYSMSIHSHIPTQTIPCQYATHPCALQHASPPPLCRSLEQGSRRQWLRPLGVSLDQPRTRRRPAPAHRHGHPAAAQRWRYSRQQGGAQGDPHPQAPADGRGRPPGAQYGQSWGRQGRGGRAHGC